jgi:hypothetical protein
VTTERTSIFRETALERLSSPEQLDQLMRITSPRSWMMLATIAILLAVALVWGFLGRVPTATSGEGHHHPWRWHIQRPERGERSD